MFSLRSAVVIGILALVALPASVAAASVRSTATPAVVSPVDGKTWAPPTGGWGYRFHVYKKTGLEEISDTSGPLSNGCYVAIGMKVARYVPAGSGLYRVSRAMLKPGKGGVGSEGKNCILSWTPATAKVKIVVGPVKDTYGIPHPTMTISCDNKPSRVCVTLTHL